MPHLQHKSELKVNCCFIIYCGCWVSGVVKQHISNVTRICDTVIILNLARIVFQRWEDEGNELNLKRNIYNWGFKELNGKDNKRWSWIEIILNFKRTKCLGYKYGSTKYLAPLWKCHFWTWGVVVYHKIDNLYTDTAVHSLINANRHTLTK